MNNPITSNHRQRNILGYNMLDLILLFAGLLTTVILTIVFMSDWLVVVCCVLGIFTVFTQAKCKISTKVFGALWMAFYIFLAWRNSYYGEVIIYLVLMIPLYVYGTIHWLGHRDKVGNTVIVRKSLPKSEWVVICVCLVGLGFGTYFLLGFFNTAQMIASTISVVLTVLAVYLLARRIKCNQIVFLVNDFELGFLWLLAISAGDLSLIPFVVMCAFFVVYDIYGFFQWTRLEKKQISGDQ